MAILKIDPNPTYQTCTVFDNTWKKFVYLCGNFGGYYTVGILLNNELSEEHVCAYIHVLKLATCSNEKIVGYAVF